MEKLEEAVSMTGSNPRPLLLLPPPPRTVRESPWPPPPQLLLLTELEVAAAVSALGAGLI